MNFLKPDGSVMSARQAWHDCFMSDIRAIDYVELANGAGVQYTAKGSDNCTMSHYAKGLVQKEIDKIKRKNPEAYALGMFSFAPVGTQSFAITKAILLPYVLRKLNIPMEPRYYVMVYRAITDVSVELVADKRVTHDNGAMASMFSVSVDEYRKQYRPKLYAIKDCLHDLAGICLSPIASLCHVIADKENGEAGALEEFQRMQAKR